MVGVEGQKVRDARSVLAVLTLHRSLRTARDKEVLQRYDPCTFSSEHLFWLVPGLASSLFIDSSYVPALLDILLLPVVWLSRVLQFCLYAVVAFYRSWWPVYSSLTTSTKSLLRPSRLVIPGSLSRVGPALGVHARRKEHVATVSEEV
jgi:hypothetical protein